MFMDRDSRVEIEGLDVSQVQAITYIDQIFFSENRIPTPDEIAGRVGVIPDAVEDWYRDRQFCNILRVRGVDLSFKSDPEILSPLQVLVTHIIFNTEDRRSLNEKLSDCGVSMPMWQGWCAEPRFKQYLRKRAIQMNDVTTTFALLELDKSVQDSDHRAVELQLRMAGLYSPTTKIEINVQQVIVSLVEVIQKHVHDPNILRAIATDIEEVERKALSSGG